jgi:hypothetical protein
MKQINRAEKHHFSSKKEGLSIIAFAIIFALAGVLRANAADTPAIPVGMNVPSLNYYTPALAFSDVMSTASDLLSYSLTKDDWDSQVMKSIPVDPQGWPLEIPYSVGGDPQGFRFLVNNYYKGDYVVLFDGEGEMTWGGVDSKVSGGLTYLFLNGKGGNVWASVSRSVKGNHIRNMRIVPADFAEKPERLARFDPLYVKGLQPFHAIRFMDWTNTNNSEQKEWADRTRPDYYSQGAKKGMSWEYAIDLANAVHADAWICVPHQASDDYIRKLAQLFLKKLDPGLKLYVEYSNEIWNWGFQQSQYVIKNAPGAEPHVVQGLREIGGKYCGNPEEACHPEKDAWMIARTFKIFSEVWKDQRKRLVKVAAVQHAWVDNTRRILKYLFEDDGIGADAVSPAGYFGFTEENHKTWNAMDPKKVTPEMILAGAGEAMEKNEMQWSRETAKWAKAYNVDYVVYEGGQHMQPFNQGEWGYNQAVWDAQIHPGMYDLYMKNFASMQEVGCKLFMAFSYVGLREIRWGSWGHLERLEDVNAKDLKEIAPKYKALLDANTPK